MSALRVVFLFAFVALLSGCTRPNEDEMEGNLVGRWTIEYYDEYTRDNWDTDDLSNGELSVHNVLVGEIEFRKDRTGVLTDSAYSQTFTWNINEGFLNFQFPQSSSANNAHPIAYHYYYGGFCDPEVQSYTVLRSEPDVHVFRYRVGGSCNLETFHCLEWAITR
jgi:hypothetical protein